MKEFKIDYDKSYDLFLKYKSRLLPKEPYKNIYKISNSEPENFLPNNQKWKIVYGYMTIFGQLICRHCFFIDENDNVIDPTIFLSPNNSKDKIIAIKYFPLRVFYDINEYNEKIKQNNWQPNIFNLIKYREKDIQQWLDRKNYLIIGKN